MLKHPREYKYINFDDVDIDETKSPLTDKKFVKFLKDNNIHDKFINNLSLAITNNDELYKVFWQSIETFCDDLKRYKYISHAFSWDLTPEGSNFWGNWNGHWRFLIR